MNWIDRFLMRFFHFLWRTFQSKRKENPYYFVIENATGDPYLCRYRLFRCPWFKIVLHHILRSDEDPDLHCHPWAFVSIVLWAGYLEILPSSARIIRPGQVVRHRATDAHRLILERPAWTLVFMTGKKRHWGFHTSSGWMPYEAYFDQKYGKGNWASY
jgi:hypothetical protein